MYSKPSNDDIHLKFRRKKFPCAFNSTAFQNHIQRKREIAVKKLSLNIKH